MHSVNPNTPSLFVAAGVVLSGLTALSAVSSAKMDDTAILFLYSLGCFALGAIVQLTIWNQAA